MDIDLKQNLGRIIRTLEGQGMKPTKIAHAIGYTTTRQLYNSLEGESQLSTKAVIGLMSNLNVNPTYLFLAKGDMFLTDETEVEKLKRENNEWIQKYNEALKTVSALKEIVKRLEKQTNEVIEMATAAKKYYESQVKESTEDDEEITDLDVYGLLLQNEFDELNSPKE